MNYGVGTIAFVLLLVVVLIVVGPIFTIMALNHLFGLSIPLDFWSWLAIFWLMACLSVRASGNNSSK
jgi:5-bromo-4-chloroindolyl phosphate hydrolysis protein